MSARQNHSGRPVGRMDAPSGKRSYTTQGARIGFERERGDAAADWRHLAACRPERLEAEGLDENLFFPAGSTGPSLAWIADAKAVCARCPVMERCLEFALENNMTEGVWGGMSEDERRAMKRRAQRANSRMV